MKIPSDTGGATNPTPRKSARVGLEAEVSLRRSGHNNYRANVHDVSQEGCKVDFVERPRLDEIVWVKFEGLEALEAIVCWVDGFAAGLEFQRPVHPAVFDVLLKRLAAAGQQ
ncbi:PilZ domain-containing protein [Sphingomonas sp.]|uniref:PilZ domain-containing protein n=1 Tax=Sphingomonas sp. TaxID=28214 RepID=UPI00286C20FD|nr:PilZ domain-containing protein [Sphingomonas sp.]